MKLKLSLVEFIFFPQRTNFPLYKKVGVFGLGFGSMLASKGHELAAMSCSKHCKEVRSVPSEYTRSSQMEREGHLENKQLAQCPKPLYSMTMAAPTSHLKFSGFNNTDLLCYSSRSQKSKACLVGLYIIQVLAGLCPFQRLWRRMHFIAFSSSQRPPTFLG